MDMEKKKSVTKSEWIDPDDAPELTQEWFDSAEIWEGNKLIRPSRPTPDAPEGTINIWLDPDVLSHFRASGPGWQSRINDALRKAAKL
jgi:uncharacterized protein (DUF4415 family)